MNTYHFNYQQFLRMIYQEKDQRKPFKYVPTPQTRQRAILRGQAASVSKRNANALFNRLTKGE